MPPTTHDAPPATGSDGELEITAEEERLVEQAIRAAMQRGQLAHDADVLEGRLFPAIW